MWSANVFVCPKINAPTPHIILSVVEVMIAVKAQTVAHPLAVRFQGEEIHKPKQTRRERQTPPVQTTGFLPNPTEAHTN